jgi:hypothetical protein
VPWILEATIRATAFTNILFFVFKRHEPCKCVLSESEFDISRVDSLWLLVFMQQALPQNMECDGLKELLELRVAGSLLPVKCKLE